MRVVAGKFRSRGLVAPPGLHTRPTSDRMRETLMNVLGFGLENSRFADLFAGSGAVGIEALSRGAASCWFVERAPAALTAVRKNVQQMGVESRFCIDKRGVLQALREPPPEGRDLGIVFLDPPYEAGEEYRATLQQLGGAAARLLASDALVVAEHARRAPLAEVYGRLQRSRVLEQGDSALSFYRLVSPGERR